MRLGRKFARVTTNAVVRRPRLWKLFRGRMEHQFDELAPVWDTMRAPTHLAAFELALEAVSPAPARVLDLGTGTGAAAFALARRFPGAQVLGVDLSDGMIAEARRKTPPESAGRVRFEQGDASALACGDASFELVSLANMIPFFDELDRVVTRDGAVLISFSSGTSTPIYVPSERLRAELAKRRFVAFEEFAAAPATAFLARRQAAG
jgi:ubiquinone/menaquinone biosynthesis C-methylase UbiE